MNKYNEIEVKTAQNLLKDDYRWIKKSRLGSILAYKIKPTENPETFIPGKKVCTAYVPIFDGIKFGDEPTSLESIVHPQILDGAEKRYLSAVIKPFRKHVQNIAKYLTYGNTEEYIIIQIDSSERVNFPHFKVGTMYKGMELDREYTLEELGL